MGEGERNGGKRLDNAVSGGEGMEGVQCKK